MGSGEEEGAGGLLAKLGCALGLLLFTGGWAFVLIVMWNGGHNPHPLHGPLTLAFIAYCFVMTWIMKAMGWDGD